MKAQVIQHKIYEIREQKVMLDFDLAILYQVRTSVLNQAIKRNMDSFPRDFMFRLTKKEWKNISQPVLSNPSQIVTGLQKHRSKDYVPYAFTEHGVTMLASVLKSGQARKMNIAIVRTFIALRKVVHHVSDIKEQLNQLKERIGEHDVQLAQIYDSIENLLDEKAEQKKWKDRERIGFVKT